MWRNVVDILGASLYGTLLCEKGTTRIKLVLRSDQADATSSFYKFLMQCNSK